ncbi:hypothetical protein Dxin01_03636 [Deinococcus xinjiangensis]|uniref:Uncharacterized protein n=1 Tax=Deinococcus xinjiangensis TaxID=457454 RepID=A0ABP9VF67_9DEIO
MVFIGPIKRIPHETPWRLSLSQVMWHHHTGDLSGAMRQEFQCDLLTLEPVGRQAQKCSEQARRRVARDWHNTLICCPSHQSQSADHIRLGSDIFGWLINQLMK